MPAAQQTEAPPSATPHSDLAGFLIERNYRDLGCDSWDARRVMLLCAKFGDTPAIMATRLRLTKSRFQERMDTDAWTKQDGLILSMLEREIDLQRGGIAPKHGILPKS